MGLDIEISGLQSAQTLKADWQFLEEQAEGSPFISWHWIEPWLEQIAFHNFESYLVKITENKQVVGLGLLHYGLVTRRKFFRRTILFLNEMPLSDNNMVIEYNGLLVKLGYEEQAWNAFCKKLIDLPKWDEVQLNGLSTRVAEQAESALGKVADLYTYEKTAAHEVYLADFTQQQSWVDAEQALLSKNKRTQIKRSIRAYESKYGGNIICTAATNKKQALDYFSNLESLHNTYWASKGLQGAFANKKWVAFNKNIIENNIGTGTVQLYCISVGEHVIGYLYNFLWKGVVYNIQSGLCYENDNKLKPGYVSHWLVMAEYFKYGARQYNFLAGTTHYKKSLSNQQELLECLLLRRSIDKRKFLLEDMLVNMVRFVRKLFSKQGPG